jgi:hypothetical protein
MSGTVTSVVDVSTSQGQTSYQVKYKANSDGSYTITASGSDPFVNTEYTAATPDEAVAGATNQLNHWGLPDTAQNQAGQQLAQIVSQNGSAKLASVSDNAVTPSSDPAAAAAQSTAATDSGAGATPTSGSSPDAVPPADPASAQTQNTATDNSGSNTTPTQGTTPQDIPPDSQGTDAFLGPDVQLPPDDGQDTDSFLGDTNDGIPGAVTETQNQATIQDATNFGLGNDWRVRIALAPGSNYLYNASPPGILGPLQATEGVIFPYTPDIQITYAGSYEGTQLTHSNYKIFQYQSSSIDQITINCPFTAQDTNEALYLLATIHFFRTLTKMFYGQDQNPNSGTPPPLCYLYGLGSFQFDNHPMVISSFNYALPTDVDYIRVSTNTVQPGVGSSGGSNTGFHPNPAQQAALKRLGGTIAPGGTTQPVDFGTPTVGTVPATYVPTMMSIQLTAYPIVSRNDISNNFSLQKYATGELITKGFW